MKLPNLENAVVSAAKVTDYLLSETHRDGKHKAAFFFAFGFSQESWESLQDVLRQHISDHDVARDQPGAVVRKPLQRGTGVCSTDPIESPYPLV